MLFTGWEVRIGRNCAGGLEYRPKAIGLFCFTLTVFLADLLDSPFKFLSE